MGEIEKRGKEREEGERERRRGKEREEGGKKEKKRKKKRRRATEKKRERDEREEERGQGGKSLLGGRANTKSVVKEHGVATLGGVLDEIVLFGFFGGVPIPKFDNEKARSYDERYMVQYPLSPASP